MIKIIHKQVIAQDIKKIDMLAEAIAQRCLPGQFVMVTPALGDPDIPLTIVDHDPRRGSISLIVHETDQASRKLADIPIGEGPYQVLGPLGKGAEIDKYGLVVCVATGIGASQILPVCRGLKKKGNKIIGVIGAKSKKVLMLESQMRVVCDEIFIATNDGSYERKGLASELLKELLNKYPVSRIYAIGSLEMMQAACRMARDKNIPVRVTVSPAMMNGLGLYGTGRIKINGEYRIACTDGPEFDGHLVDFRDLSRRMNELESKWADQPHLISPKKPGFKTFVKSLWGSVKK